MHSEHQIQLALRSLKGVSIGDAFGESFFGDRNIILEHIGKTTIPQTSWEFTDDTVMAIAIFEQLESNGEINQDELAFQFVVNHDKDVNRGYGSTARRILREIKTGVHWKEASSIVFDGMGSMGNGASMRASPIGAYYFNDLQKVKMEAIKSAEITHANIEAIVGAIAVALATALATQTKISNETITPNDFIKNIVKELPDSDTTSKINKSLSVPYSYNIETIRSILGDGTGIMAKDTVPFSIWCAAHNLSNFEHALWKAVSILGDRDTICAIVGGITVMSANEKTIPPIWESSVENFELSLFRNT